MSVDQTRFPWASAESQFPEGWRLYTVVIETMTNSYLAKRGWRVGLPVRCYYNNYGGDSFELVDPRVNDVQTWLYRSDAEEVVRQCGNNFNGVTFRILEFSQVRAVGHR